VKYLLDTGICIYIINERPQHLRARFDKEVVGDVGISAITASELAYGVAKTDSARNRAALDRFMLPLEVAPYGPEAASVYGDLRARLEHGGEVIGPLDMLIAAHAVALGVTLVTNNTGEFRRVPGLRCENWIR
jgi:tRNA(fMet)-specific endonuclease VapC